MIDLLESVEAFLSAEPGDERRCLEAMSTAASKAREYVEDAIDAQETQR